MPNHVRTVWVKSIVAFACAVILLAQAALALHKAGTDQHSAGEQCEYCVAGTSLTAGLAGAGLVAPCTHDVVPVITVRTGVDAPAHHAYHSRAPPNSILV